MSENLSEIMKQVVKGVHDAVINYRGGKESFKLAAPSSNFSSLTKKKFPVFRLRYFSSEYQVSGFTIPFKEYEDLREFWAKNFKYLIEAKSEYDYAEVLDMSDIDPIMKYNWSQTVLSSQELSALSVEFENLTKKAASEYKSCQDEIANLKKEWQHQIDELEKATKDLEVKTKQTLMGGFAYNTSRTTIDERFKSLIYEAETREIIFDGVMAAYPKVLAAMAVTKRYPLSMNFSEKWTVHLPISKKIWDEGDRSHIRPLMKTYCCLLLAVRGSIRESDFLVYTTEMFIAPGSNNNVSKETLRLLRKGKDKKSTELYHVLRFYYLKKKGSSYVLKTPEVLKDRNLSKKDSNRTFVEVRDLLDSNRYEPLHSQESSDDIVIETPQPLQKEEAKREVSSDTEKGISKIKTRRRVAKKKSSTPPSSEPEGENPSDVQKKTYSEALQNIKPRSTSNPNLVRDSIESESQPPVKVETPQVEKPVETVSSTDQSKEPEGSSSKKKKKTLSLIKDNLPTGVHCLGLLELIGKVTFRVVKPGTDFLLARIEGDLLLVYESIDVFPPQYDTAIKLYSIALNGRTIKTNEDLFICISEQPKPEDKTVKKDPLPKKEEGTSQPGSKKDPIPEPPKQGVQDIPPKEESPKKETYSSEVIDTSARIPDDLYRDLCETLPEEYLKKTRDGKYVLKPIAILMAKLYSPATIYEMVENYLPEEVKKIVDKDFLSVGKRQVKGQDFTKIWSDIKKKHKGVRLVSNPKTKAEKAYKRAYDQLLKEIKAAGAPERILPTLKRREGSSQGGQTKNKNLDGSIESVFTVLDRMATILGKLK